MGLLTYIIKKLLIGIPVIFGVTIILFYIMYILPGDPIQLLLSGERVTPERIEELRTSWSFIGAGLRLTFEVLGPEYSLSINTLQPELFTFISRNIKIPPTEEFVEKQNAEQGLMPIIPDEAFTYGYQAEDAHMVNSFIERKTPYETWHDGLLVVQLMMHAYLSAEKGAKIPFEPVQVRDYIPPVARSR